MTPDISEFTYGFALTNELVGWMAMSAVPIFPSLIEEGKATGGYDVKLDAPGVPLYLQFKRSHVMKRKSANEIKNFGLSLSVPFHRFTITESKRSLQHASLVALDDGVNEVFYVAPRFHTLTAINTAWSNKRVAQRSIFVAPSDIGLIADDLRHTVSFDEANTYFCSEPRRIKAVNIEELRARLAAKLDVDDRPVEAKLDEWIGGMATAATKARDMQAALEKSDLIFKLPTPSLPALPSMAERAVMPTGIRRIEDRLPAMALRDAKPLPPEREKLRKLADDAHTQFNAQLIIVQPT